MTATVAGSCPFLQLAFSRLWGRGARALPFAHPHSLAPTLFGSRPRAPALVRVLQCCRRHFVRLVRSTVCCLIADRVLEYVLPLRLVGLFILPIKSLKFISFTSAFVHDSTF